MKKQHSSSSSTSSRHRSQVQLNQSYRQANQIGSKEFITPERQDKNKIFLETPQAVYIPISQKQQQSILQFVKKQQPFTQQRKNKKVSIFDKNLYEQKKQNSQKLNPPPSKLQKQQDLCSNVIKSKISISFKRQRISEFFYYQNYIVCKSLRKIIVYNFFNKYITHIPVECDEFVLTPFPPYVFNCITGQYLNLYSEDAVQKYSEIQRKRQNALRKKTGLETTPIKSQNEEGKNNFNQAKEDFNSIEVVVVKISKLEVQCICKYGQLLYMGGYNRSILPGGKKSERREIYLMDHVDPSINNKPKQIIKINSSHFPVSAIQVQMPYLIVYCRPNFYFFSLKSHELLLTFQKQLRLCFLLEGRYALNVINGIGISNRNGKQNIFTYDIQNTPIFGVQINQHKQEATCICLQKTGRIFGCNKSALFEYIPSKRLTRCVKLYSQSETILWIESTPNNNLLVLRQTQRLQYAIEAFSVNQNSIGDY